MYVKVISCDKVIVICLQDNFQEVFQEIVLTFHESILIAVHIQITATIMYMTKLSYSITYYISLILSADNFYSINSSTLSYPEKFVPDHCPSGTLLMLPFSLTLVHSIYLLATI